MTLPNIDDLSLLGGIKINYAPIEDTTTDLDADQDNVARADVAMMTHTAVRAWVRFTSAATTGAMVRVAHDALWGNTSGVAPILARSSTGIFTFTWPSSVNDELGMAHATNLRAAWIVWRGSTLYHCQCAPTSANVVTARVYDSSHALNDAAGIDFDIFAI